MGFLLKEDYHYFDNIINWHSSHCFGGALLLFLDSEGFSYILL